MAYTETDLQKVEAAIIELASGERVTRIEFSDGHVVEYASARLSDLRKLKLEIAAELNRATQKRTWFVPFCKKGL